MAQSFNGPQVRVSSERVSVLNVFGEIKLRVSEGTFRSELTCFEVKDFVVIFSVCQARRARSVVEKVWSVSCVARLLPVSLET